MSLIIIWLIAACLNLSLSPQRYLTKQELVVLNQEYARIVKEERQKLDENDKKVEVYFDSNMMYGTIVFNYTMEHSDSLYHDKSDGTFSGENCGRMMDGEYTTDAKVLARYIYERFKKSPPHNTVQINPSYKYISVSCTPNYFVARYSYSKLASPPPKSLYIYNRLVTENVN